MSIHINDLSYDLLKYMLNFLLDKQLFVVEAECSKWQKCVLKLSEQKTTLKHLDYHSFLFIIDNRIVVNSSNIDIPKNILLRCHNIKEINLNGIVTGN